MNGDGKNTIEDGENSSTLITNSIVSMGGAVSVWVRDRGTVLH